jgi:hypothetical protein
VSVIVVLVPKEMSCRYILSKFVISWLVLMIFTVAELSIGANDIEDFYAIVVDAGSTGSRAFVFNIVEEIGPNNTIVSRSLHSMKGKKIAPGISDFVTKLSDSDAIVSYLLPVFENASSLIPKEKHSSTKVYIKGYFNCHSCLRPCNICIAFRNSWYATITGSRARFALEHRMRRLEQYFLESLSYRYRQPWHNIRPS